jgi:hypothetical protein
LEEEVDWYDDEGQNTDGTDGPSDKLYPCSGIVVVIFAFGYLPLVLRTENVLDL